MDKKHKAVLQLISSCLQFKIFLTAVIAISSAHAAYAKDVIVSGECVGVKLYTNGLIVCDTSAVTERDGTRKDIAKGYDIKKGDVITRVNGENVFSNETITKTLSETRGDITLTIERGGTERDVTVTPADTENGPKLGLWLRDSTAGLGTITCYDGDKFAALGHGICDIDTGTIMPVGRGIIQQSRITAVAKSENGSPGAISGEIDGRLLGTITANRENGLFGTLKSEPSGQSMEIADKSEIKCAPATILADVDGEGVKEYSIEIKKIFATAGGRDMVIKITDDALIEKTGGIVQGMSGAPIIQNGKLAGAVTHVFVNDALSGYAIFAENLLKGSE